MIVNRPLTVAMTEGGQQVLGVVFVVVRVGVGVGVGLVEVVGLAVVVGAAVVGLLVEVGLVVVGAGDEVVGPLPLMLPPPSAATANPTLGALTSVSARDSSDSDIRDMKLDD